MRSNTIRLFSASSAICKQSQDFRVNGSRIIHVRPLIQQRRRQLLQQQLQQEQQRQYHYGRTFSSALPEQRHSLEEDDEVIQRRRLCIGNQFHDKNSRSKDTIAEESVTYGYYNNDAPVHPIFVGATREHVGKTTVSLALMNGLQKRFSSPPSGNRRRGGVGFIKPVGQQSNRVIDYDHNEENCLATGKEILCDKDAALVKEYFHLNHLQYQHMNPVTIPPGYTRDYIDGRIPQYIQRDQIVEAYNRISSQSDFVLCEGTGHCAVGSIVNANNALVASWLNAKMILVANGGLGNTFDELELNRLVCDQHELDIAGVIINKVVPEKYEQTQYYITRAIEQNWGSDIPVLGCIPDRPFLGCPSVDDLQDLLQGSSIICGKQYRYRHYDVNELNLVATSLQVFLKKLRNNASRTLYICHASRNDILLGFLMETQRMKQEGKQNPEAALMVCDSQEYPLSTQVLDIIQGLENDTSDGTNAAPPILVVPHGTRNAMANIHSYTPKLHCADGHRVQIAIEHYEPYIDFDLLLEKTGHKKSNTMKKKVEIISGN